MSSHSHVPLPLDEEEDQDAACTGTGLDDADVRTPPSSSPTWTGGNGGGVLARRLLLVAIAATVFVGAASSALVLLARSRPDSVGAAAATDQQLPQQQQQEEEEDDSPLVGDDPDQDEVLKDLAERMRPRSLVLTPVSDGAIPPKQFAHLHHMKTGGTSVNRLLKCALDRLERVLRLQSDGGGESESSGGGSGHRVGMFQVSECSQSSYRRCISGEDERCNKQVRSSPIMSYCAPLFQTNQFGWDDADMITVLRHPVDRVWSMFRFQTKGCFKCVPLLDVYRSIDNGTVEDVLCGGKPCEGICVTQILDHQVRNLLTSPTSQNMTEDARLEEALHNLRNRFAVVGVTGELNTTARMIGHTFPWMAETYGGDEGRCALPHANASPRNNRCGADGGHWDLPDQPDEETRQAILEHNRLDMALYDAAAQYFVQEKRALGWD